MIDMFLRYASPTKIRESALASMYWSLDTAYS